MCDLLRIHLCPQLETAATLGELTAAIVNFKKKLEHASRKSILALVRPEIWDMVVKTCVKMIDVE